MNGVNKVIDKVIMMPTCLTHQRLEFGNRTQITAIEAIGERVTEREKGYRPWRVTVIREAQDEVVVYAADEMEAEERAIEETDDFYLSESAMAEEISPKPKPEPETLLELLKSLR